MSRPFLFGLVSASLGLVMAVLARIAGAGATGFLDVFAIITLVGCLTGAVLLGKHVHETEDGYVGVGDAFFAIATVVVLVEVVVLTLTGSFLVLAYGAVALAATLWGLRQERQVSLVVCGLLSLLALVWVASDTGTILAAWSPALLWAFATGAYLASLATGEQVGEPVSA